MVGQNVYNKLQGFQTQWTSICTQARRHIESNAATEPLPQTIGWGYHYLLSDGPNRFNKVGGSKPWGFLSFLYSKNLPHPVMAHHTPNLCWQSPESQSVMLRLPKRVIAVASYPNIPKLRFFETCSNKYSHFTTWKSSAFLFRRSFSLGWTSPSATFEPRCVSRCVIGEMMPQMAVGVLKKRV